MIKSAKGKFQGCKACAAAVKTAATMPAGVKLLCDPALYTIARVTGIAIAAFMVAQTIYQFLLKTVGRSLVSGRQEDGALKCRMSQFRRTMSAVLILWLFVGSQSTTSLWYVWLTYFQTTRLPNK